MSPNFAQPFDLPVSDPSQSLPAPVEGAPFHDRRVTATRRRTPGMERRQFANSYQDVSPEAAELGRAIDAYKIQHHRRFINLEEILAIIKSLGYQKS